MIIAYTSYYSWSISYISYTSYYSWRISLPSSRVSHLVEIVVPYGNEFEERDGVWNWTILFSVTFKYFMNVLQICLFFTMTTPLNLKIYKFDFFNFLTMITLTKVFFFWIWWSFCIKTLIHSTNKTIAI